MRGSENGSGRAAGDAGYRARRMQISAIAQRSRHDRRRHGRDRRVRRRGARRRTLRRRSASCSTRARRARSFKALALTHADGKRWLVVGLGERGELRRRARARGGRRRVRARAARLGAHALLGAARRRRRQPPAHERRSPRRSSRARSSATTASSATSRAPATTATASRPPRSALERLIVAGADGLEDAVAEAAVVGEAANRARDLQNRPGNDLTPTALGEYAQALRERARRACRSRSRDATGIVAPRHGRVRGGRPGLRAGAGADHDRIRRPEAGTPLARGPRRSASSARR